jgi:hypothetical protein
VSFNTTQLNILLLNLKLDKLEFLLDFLKSWISFNETCVHNFSGHYILHHPIEMNLFFILCKLVAGIVGMQNQHPPFFLLYLLLGSLVEVRLPTCNHLSHLGRVPVT